MVMTIEWFDPKEKLPEEDNLYLVLRNRSVPISVVYYATNLSQADEIDFPEEEFNHPGFYDFDGSRYRHFAIRNEDILYWAEIPKIKEDKRR